VGDREEWRQLRRDLEQARDEARRLHAELTAHQVDTLEQAWVSAANLFFVIEEKHGTAFARDIFSWFGGESKPDRKALFDKRLREYYEDLSARLGRPIDKRKFAEHLSKKSARDGWFYGFGRPGDHATADAVRSRLNEALKRVKGGG
jgi:uncharacterized protein with beta-barrel porin domain